MLGLFSANEMSEFFMELFTDFKYYNFNFWRYFNKLLHKTSILSKIHKSTSIWPEKHLSLVNYKLEDNSMSFL